MFFHALVFAVSRESCLNLPPGRGFKLLPRDTAYVNALNALKYICLTVILALSPLFNRKYHKKVKTRRKLIKTKTSSLKGNYRSLESQQGKKSPKYFNSNLEKREILIFRHSRAANSSQFSDQPEI